MKCPPLHVFFFLATECFWMTTILQLKVAKRRLFEKVSLERWKKALGFLLKSELCRNCSRFRMQFCLGVLNNILRVSPLRFASFLSYYVCKKHIFSKASSGDLLLNEKQKKPFVSLKDEVTIMHRSLTTASLAPVDEALNGLD